MAMTWRYDTLEVDSMMVSCWIVAFLLYNAGWLLIIQFCNSVAAYSRASSPIVQLQIFYFVKILCT